VGSVREGSRGPAACGALDLGGEREQRRLVALAAEQLRADRQALRVSPAGTLIAGQPTTFQAKAKGQMALAVVLVAQ
jgi:hypothetical protein